jgi:hypothetical protein
MVENNVPTNLATYYILKCKKLDSLYSLSHLLELIKKNCGLGISFLSNLASLGHNLNGKSFI